MPHCRVVYTGIENMKTHEDRLLSAPPLSLKALITTAADDIHFSLFFREIRLDVSSESSARQRIHRKNQALFSLKDKSKKLKCRLLQFLFSALRVKLCICKNIENQILAGLYLGAVCLNREYRQN